MSDLSVIVCTRNRADCVRACLERLVTLDAGPGASWELIVVDNGSDDRTMAVIREVQSRAPVPLIALDEPVPGHARARNRGLHAAMGEILALTDDDCIVAEDWLRRLRAAFGADPALGLLGGRVELHDPTDRKVTIKTKSEAQVLADARGLDGFLHGCNHAFRREVWRTVGDYDVRFGHGTRIPGGDDTDFAWRAFRAGFKVAYEPSVVVAHAHGRKTEDDERELRRGYRIAIAALQTKHILNKDSSMLAWAAHDLLRHGGRVLGIMADRGGARGGAALLAQQVIGTGRFLQITFSGTGGRRGPAIAGGRPAPPSGSALQGRDEGLRRMR